MAHTDACKFQVCQLVEKIVERGVSVNEAAKIAQQESDGIPAETIRRWWWEINKKSDELFKNEQHPENQDAPTVKTGDSGDIVREVERKVRAGKSIREAAGEVAETLGKNPETVRKAYSREVERVGDPARASQAMYIVGYAIVQLERLTKSDPRWEEAITKLESWIARFKEQGE